MSDTETNNIVEITAGAKLIFTHYDGVKENVTAVEKLATGKWLVRYEDEHTVPVNPCYLTVAS
jgi:hypothetical protein